MRWSRQPPIPFITENRRGKPRPRKGRKGMRQVMLQCWPPSREALWQTLSPWRTKWKWSHSVVSDSLRPHGFQPTRRLCPWDFPHKGTGVGCHCLLQGIFLTHELNPGLPHCRQMLYPLSHQGSPLKDKAWGKCLICRQAWHWAKLSKPWQVS